MAKKNREAHNASVAVHKNYAHFQSHHDNKYSGSVTLPDLKKNDYINIYAKNLSQSQLKSANL
jgi:hypothetical protein